MEISYERKIDLKLILSIIATGLMSFTGVVVETAMNVTFPTLMEQFNVGTSTVQWVTTGYLLVLAIIIPASSFLKKRFMTKHLFLFANIMFIIGTVLAATAPSFSLLLIGRILQGIGTGIALPLMYNIVLEQTPLNKLGLMMGIATLIIAVAPAAGPSLGGFIVYSFNWRMIFIVLLPILVLSFFIGLFSIRQVRPTEKVTFDWFEYVFLAIGFTCFIFAVSFAGIMGWGSFQVIGLFVLSIISLVVFYRHSKKNDAPIINLHVLQYKSFSFSVVALMLIQFICLGLGFLIPNYAQIVSGKNALVAGCILLPGCILGAILTPISGRLLDKFGAKKPILIGITFITISTLFYSIFALNMTILLFVLFYILFGIGQSFSTGNVMTNGLKQLPEKMNLDGNAVFNTIQQLAGAIGTSVVSTIVSTAQVKLPDDLAAATMLGSRNAFILLLILAFIAFFCLLRVLCYISSKKI
ncbi:MDR family MFS transporter [Heyndrickxia camelliae]|uniref:MFS transporter n=1 Tax=Heyndrickxia camelliae TaxID=1707093 RepID=A0A2N3LHJ8_9BACI|nr:MDR family MFS transporter [Heyndrickxia camelliae]PKR84081.1 MFS transporter [Heyndrickxia camelliae]